MYSHSKSRHTHTHTLLNISWWRPHTVTVTILRELASGGPPLLTAPVQNKQSAILVSSLPKQNKKQMQRLCLMLNSRKTDYFSSLNGFSSSILFLRAADFFISTQEAKVWAQQGQGLPGPCSLLPDRPSLRLRSQSLGHLSSSLHWPSRRYPTLALFLSVSWLFFFPHFVFFPSSSSVNMQEAASLNLREMSSQVVLSLCSLRLMRQQRRKPMALGPGQVAGSAGFGGLSTGNKRFKHNMVDWWKPVPSSPFLYLS